MPAEIKGVTKIRAGHYRHQGTGLRISRGYGLFAGPGGTGVWGWRIADWRGMDVRMYPTLRAAIAELDSRAEKNRRSAA